MPQHVVLLGDSILDNAAYVPGRPAVVDQVKNRMPPGWQVTLGARDGSVINDVLRQLVQIPSDASHLVISAGGNDLLLEIGVLQERVRTVGEGLRLLAAVRNRFNRDYHCLLEALQQRGLPIVICAIYNPCSPDEVLQCEIVEAISLFDDCIVSKAREFGFPVIDLRAVCTEIADFANPIEPSSSGGAKIAQAICDMILNVDFRSRGTFLFPQKRLDHSE
jgi:GDSL-like Lipase/Acylhydrolase family